jgi:hypothetical protein
MRIFLLDELSGDEFDGLDEYKLFLGELDVDILNSEAPFQDRVTRILTQAILG